MDGLEGSLKVKEPRTGMVGLGRSSKIIELWGGWVGKVLKDHRTIGWLDWKGP